MWAKFNEDAPPSPKKKRISPSASGFCPGDFVILKAEYDFYAKMRSGYDCPDWSLSDNRFKGKYASSKVDFFKTQVAAPMATIPIHYVVKQSPKRKGIERWSLLSVQTERTKSYAASEILCKAEYGLNGTSFNRWAILEAISSASKTAETMLKNPFAFYCDDAQKWYVFKRAEDNPTKVVLMQPKNKKIGGVCEVSSLVKNGPSFHEWHGKVHFSKTGLGLMVRSSEPVYSPSQRINMEAPENIYTKSATLPDSNAQIFYISLKQFHPYGYPAKRIPPLGSHIINYCESGINSVLLE